VGLGVKCSKEVATAIRGAIILAKLSIVPVRRGYWGNKIGKPHTVPCKVSYLVLSVFYNMSIYGMSLHYLGKHEPRKLCFFQSCFIPCLKNKMTRREIIFAHCN